MDKIETHRVQELAKRKGLGAKQLAKLLGVSERSAHRLFSGESATAGRTIRLERLAQILDVEPGVLTGDLPMPEAVATEAENLGGGRPATLKLSIAPSAFNALVLNRLRYRVPLRTQVEVAALLFHVLAQRSLRHRTEAVTKIEAAEAALRAVGQEAAPHLPPMVMRTWAEDAVGVEERSIEAEDIFAEQHLALSDYVDNLDNPEGNNPFVVELRRLAEGLPGIEAEIAVQKDDVDYRINRSQAMAIAGGAEELAEAVLDGRVSLEGMRGLLAEERRDDRVAELRRRFNAWKPLSLDDLL